MEIFMEFNIDENQSLYLEEKFLECEGLKNLLNYIAQSSMQYNQDTINKYINKYLELYKEVELIKSEIINSVGINNNQYKNINFDFDNHKIICEE
jgi:hypothetical protein